MKASRRIAQRQAYLRERLQQEVRALSHSVPCNVVRRHPWLGAGGAAVAGVVAGRTLQRTSHATLRSGKWLGENLVRTARFMFLSALAAH